MLVKVKAAVSPAVSLADARQYCNAPADDDALVERALQAAVAYAEQHAQLVLAPTCFEWRAHWWPGGAEVVLPVAPLREVASVKYLDAGGVERTVAPADYTWRRTCEGAGLRFTTDFAFPPLADAADAVRIALSAGFSLPADEESDPELVLPPQAAMAVLMLTEHWYEYRGIVSEGTKAPLVLSADALLAQLRIYR